MGKKINGILLKITITLIGIILIAVFSAGGFYVLTSWRLDTVEGKVKSIETNDLPNIEDDIDYHDDRLYEQEKEVLGIKRDIGHLTEKVDRNFKDQQEFQVEQRTMQKEIIKEIKELHE